ncbi:MAG: DUF1799 domain-containing protein [Nitrosomonas sp.]|uniref:DUF1799 domain-containing protein n=1 Tax=Nitrosomonas sp. TaxID=42353 RepID=UPI0025F3651A|nr:DUF1799 domain-containing protein [Nitrosomonas sp.]MBY0474219.1 DUF1799 domain-containing protein [Nitrosomonas sp.]
MIACNAPPHVIETAKRNFSGSQENDCDVWEENWESVMLFLAMGTQWTVSATGHAIGINYVSLESAMKLANIKKKKRASLFIDVRIMESAALDVYREKQN